MAGNDNDDGSTDDASSEEQPAVFETSPTLRPTMVWLALVVLAGLAVVGYVTANRGRFEDPATARIVVRGAAALTLVGVVRFGVRLYVLSRTTYRVGAQSVVREYELLFKTYRRTVPYRMVRSHELRQSRIQKLLGYGTLALNQGLGTIELENVPSPHTVDRRLGNILSEGK